MVVNELGQKVACEPCIRGHRSSKCRHERDRPMLQVKRPGRPLSSTCGHRAKNLKCDCPPRNVTITAAIPKNKSCVCGSSKTASTDVQRVNSKGAISKNAKKPCSRRDSRGMPKIEDQAPTLSSRTSSSTSISMDRTPSSSNYSAGTSFGQVDTPQTIPQQNRGLHAHVPPTNLHSACHHMPQHGIPFQNYSPNFDFMSQPGFVPADPALMSALPGPLDMNNFSYNPLSLPLTQFGDISADSYGVNNGLIMETSRPMISLDNGFPSNSCCSREEVLDNQFPLDNGFEMPKFNAAVDQDYSVKTMSCCQGPSDQINTLGMPPVNGNGVSQHSDNLTQDFLLNSTTPKFTGSHHDHFRFQYPEGYGGSDRPLTEEDWRAAHSTHAFCVDSTTTDLENEGTPLKDPGDSETQHMCSCGDTCQCWACPAHPFNEHTLGRLRDAAAHSFCNEYEASPEDADGIPADPAGLTDMQSGDDYLYVKYDFANIIDPHAPHHHHNHVHHTEDDQC